jgi:hypothetical protein
MAHSTAAGVRFGLLSDVQYADKESRDNSRGVSCAYRASLPKLAAVVASLNNATPALDFVLHLGDLIGE